MALYYLVPRFPTATFDLGSRLGAITSECIVPENVHTAPPPRPLTEIPRGGGGGGSKRRQFPRRGGGGGGGPNGGNFREGGGGGVGFSRVFSGGSTYKIDRL